MENETYRPEHSMKHLLQHCVQHLTYRFHFSVRLFSNRCTDDVKMWENRKVRNETDEAEWRDCSYVIPRNL